MKNDIVPTTFETSQSAAGKLRNAGWNAEVAPALTPPDVSNAVNLPLVGWVREATVLEVIHISKSTMWVWIKNGIFPAPTRLGPRVTAWSARSLRRYIEDPANWAPEKAAHNSAHEVLL